MTVYVYKNAFLFSPNGSNLIVSLMIFHLIVNIFEVLNCNGELLIQSCVELEFIENLNPALFPSSGSLQMFVWIDNDRSTIRSSPTYTWENVTNGEIDFNELTMCWDYPSTNITTTGFNVDKAQVVQLSINDDTLQGYIFDIFSDAKETTSLNRRPNTPFISAENITLTYRTFHQGIGGYLKIANRNHMYQRECFQFYQLCFYLPNLTSSASTCDIYGDIVDSSPTFVGSTSNLTDNNESTRWPDDDSLAGSDTACWEPYQQYLIINLSDVEFGSIGIGFIGSNFSLGDYEATSSQPSRYFTFAFADSIPNDDLGWQYWATDFLNDSLVTSISSGTNGIFYAVNPLDLIRDTDPADLQNRFTRIIYGIPEMYSVNVDLPYKVSGTSTTTFTTWTLWMLDQSSGIFNDDNNALQMGQLATVTCRNVFGTNYSSSLSSMFTNTNANPDCWGTGVSTSNCNSNIFGPPMRYKGFPVNNRQAYCNKTGIDSSYADWADCATTAEAIVYDCDATPDDCDGREDQNAWILTGFSCIQVYQEDSIAPSPSPTAPEPSVPPIRSPSDAPSISPTYSPSNTPVNNPTRAPSTMPSISPSVPPSFSPSTAPSNNPTRAPSRIPSISPSIAPTSAPYMKPTNIPSVTPTSAPTNELCDSGVQTHDTFIACKFLLEIKFEQTIDNPTESLHSSNYCIDNVMNKYFQCQNENDNSTSSITHILLNNSNIDGPLTENSTLFLFELSKHCLISLDLSNNTMTDEITDWSMFRFLKVLILANNSFSGSVDMTKLTTISQNSTSTSSQFIKIDMSSNSFDSQGIAWNVFEYLNNIEYFDISDNQFNGRIELSYFENCEKLKYFNVAFNQFGSIDGFDELESFCKSNLISLEQLIINNNEIETDFTMTYFTKCRDLQVIKCHNNKLSSSNIDMSDIPESLIIFECGNNDFGEFVWKSQQYDDYSLQIVELRDAQMHGSITMKFFDNNGGGYNELVRVDLSSNRYLNLSADFEFLDGQARIEYLNLSTTDIHGSVDFSYLTESNETIIVLDKKIYCVDSYCNDEPGGKNYGFERTSDTCKGRERCLDTCTCDTAFTLGLESFDQSTTSKILLNILIIVIFCLIFGVIVGKMHARELDERLGFSIGKKSDHFQFGSSLAFVSQIWDFFSDLLLSFEIYDRYYQASINNPDKNTLLYCFIASITFTFIPWCANLLFLMQTNHSWRKGNDGGSDKNDNKNDDKNNKNNYNCDALYQSSISTNKWLNNYSKFLIFLCMISGGLCASLKIVNSNLFGLKWFNMGLSKYKQDETARHRLWLTILLENIPQIIVSTFYATQLAGFNSTVLIALISSISSVILAILSAFVEFPKNYYIYQISIQINVSQNPQLKQSLRMRNRISRAICNSMSKDSGLFFVENVYFDGINVVCFNLVSHEPIKGMNKKTNGSKLDRGKLKFEYFQRRNIINSLKNDKKLRINCQKLWFTFVTHKKVKLNCCFFSFFDKHKTKQEKEENLKQIQMGIRNIDMAHKIPSSNISLDMISPDQSEISIENALCSHMADSNYDQESTSQWRYWTRKQVTNWIDTRIRQTIQDRHNACAQENDLVENVEIESLMWSIDDDTQDRIENFMSAFDQLDIDGESLYRLKQNQEKMKDLQRLLTSKSFGFWIIVSDAIEELNVNLLQSKDVSNVFSNQCTSGNNVESFLVNQYE